MATRSLTEVFVLMRNNAIRSRHIYNDQDTSERMQLVSLNDTEEGAGGDYLDNSMPPEWIDQLEESQFTISKLKTKIQDIKLLHSRHFNRPTFDDNTEDEKLIENCSAEIQGMFNVVYRNVQYIKGHSSDGNMKQRQLTLSVVRALANILQDLSTQFRSTQNNYLRQIQSREERSKIFFDNPALEEDSMMLGQEEDIDEYFLNSRQSQQLLQLEEENTRMIQQREHKVNAIVKSILDLNSIFKDLSQMVADQGTILDRIDYNVEQTQTQVYEGFKQLQKADAYQRKNRKMCTIIILATAVIVLVVLLILVKT
ncbi:syntaxin-16 [Onthophagus taurus]|uniref:syntaxin-16 n=1 Tax=Onthophagus taurus TaxID=166361 RepID=UPI0039BE9368